MTVDNDDNLYIAEGDEDIWKSTDSGSTWTKAATEMNGGNGNIHGMAVVQNTITNISVFTRSCDDSACDGEAWNGPYTNSNLTNLNENNNTYFQYKVLLETDNAAYTPTIYNVTVNYTLLNQQPVISSLSLTPSNPKTADDLTCAFIITDDDAGDT